MSWRCRCIENTVVVSDACARELFDRFRNPRAAADDGEAVAANWGPSCVEDWYDPESVCYDGKLQFGSDEWLDYFTPEIFAVLLNHGVEGRICFADLEGSSTPKFWGYEFTSGEVCKLKGAVVWAPAC